MILDVVCFRLLGKTLDILFHAEYPPILQLQYTMQILDYEQYIPMTIHSHNLCDCDRLLASLKVDATSSPAALISARESSDLGIILHLNGFG